MPRELPSLNALRAFEATARLASMTRAADELHVTHGAVSRQIRALEADLGTPLFRRQGRGLALTAGGLRLREAATDAFGQLRDVCHEIRHGAAQAPFVLGCPGSLLARWMIPRLDRLGHDLPELKLHLSADEAALGDPALPGLDAALLLAERPWPATWQVHTLAPELIGPVLSPRYAGFERLRKGSKPALRKEALLHTASRPQAWPAWAHAEHIDPKTLRLGQGFEHLYYLLEAAVAGLGVAIAPQPLVADDLAAGRLVAPWGFRKTRGAWLLGAPQRAGDARLAALAAWLRAELAQA
ncbi:LysR family transcriptional regulator [Frateuria defendens]|uniref:LysR family transcriptional regulator n=1 Tax=Frateuria defendens TaxID=2219559 RepID=UPI00066FCC3B|nr:LysR family transcriptional regulator [Frateuria defendens]